MSTNKPPPAGPKSPLKINGDKIDISIHEDKTPQLHRPPTCVKLQDPVGLKFIGSADGPQSEELFINHPAADWSAMLYKGEVALLERSLAMGIVRSAANKGHWAILEVEKGK